MTLRPIVNPNIGIFTAFWQLPIRIILPLWAESNLQQNMALITAVPAYYGAEALACGLLPEIQAFSRVRKDNGSLPSGKRSSKPNNRNRHDKGGNILTDAPASFYSLCSKLNSINPFCMMIICYKHKKDKASYHYCPCL